MVKTNKNGKIIHTGSKIIKIIKNPEFFEEDLIRNINFLINNNIPNTPKVYMSLEKDGKVVGYVMDEIKKSTNFREIINNPKVSIEKKMTAINDILETVDYLHKKDIVIGDINLENLLIDNKGHGYIIDLDYIHFIGDEFKFDQLYLIKQNDEKYPMNKVSNYTDDAKIFISIASILLNVDLEEEIDEANHSINLEQIYNKYIKNSNNEFLINYYNTILKNNNKTLKK